jgi:hypothetical protein
LALAENNKSWQLAVNSWQRAIIKVGGWQKAVGK